MKRQMIEIDRAKCNGCGLCTKICAEGALALDAEGKAVVVNEIFCDGLGACLAVCPVDALKVVEKEVAAYDAKATVDHVKKTRGAEAALHVHGAEELVGAQSDASDSKKGGTTMEPIACGCPGSMAKEIQKKTKGETGTATVGPAESELSQWPIQLHLVSPQAPYFNECDLLIAADCTAFALGSFHADLLKGKKIAIACPKLDDPEGYLEKIAELLKNNTIYSLTVAIMSVPCCSGLYHLVQQAVELSGTKMNIRKVVIGLDGEITK
jgi:Pyruvate/2-oxoacid:ferredoxin oxidoreductase delta subunit